MTFDEYQRQARVTSTYRDVVLTQEQLDDEVAHAAVLAISMGAMGLAGESGEVADYLKKILHHGHALDRARLVKELGDVLWYVAETASVFGITMSEIADTNIEKLRKRYPVGFTTERSQNRDPGDE